MDTDTSELFCRQLADWAETAIEQGRYPFRKIDTFPTLLTESGEMHPPLVFWINRDSCMAGGVLLLPRKEAVEAVDMGRHCAKALGLSHFVTWAAREVVIWEDSGGAAKRLKTLSLQGAGSNAASDFRDALAAIMGELKVLSVVGAVPPLQLSPYCLANLCRSTLEAALPSVEEGYRLARSEGRLEAKAPTTKLAFGKGVLSLLRLLALCFHDRLPNAIQPEGLERAMLFALDTLPQALRAALQPGGEEIALPPESAIRFHHLLRRLTQLQYAKDWQRAARTVEILLENWAQRLGGSPLFFAPEPANGLTLMLNPERPCPAAGPFIEIADPPLLAFFALQRNLQQVLPGPLQSADPFTLPPTLSLAAVRGSLTDESLPAEPGRRQLAMHLRISWPARRLSLPPRTPVWAWTFVHLLGLTEAGGDIAVQTPPDWLTAPYGERLQELIAEECVVRFLSQDAEGRLHLRLIRGQDPAALTTIQGPESLRQIPWQQFATGHRSLYRLALELPDILFSLLQEQILRLPGTASWTENHERAVFLFTRSALGSWLWALVSDGHPLPPAQTLHVDILRWGLPVPTDSILAALQQLPAEKTEKLSQAVFETELMQLLGLDITFPVHSMRKNRPRSRADGHGRKLDREELAEQIIAKACVDGLPRFPEQYLYDYYRPLMNEFRYNGPLRISDEFFGRVRLIDQMNQILEVEGSITARALLLASYGNPTEAALPADQELTLAIFSRYLSDLRSLHQELKRQCHLRIAESRAADAMVEHIWQLLPLPPWPLVEP